MVFPTNNLPSAAVPWAREVEKQVTNTATAVRSNELNNSARDNQLASAMTRLNSTVSDVQANVAAIQTITDNVFVTGTTEINGYNIKAGTIDADAINAGTLTGFTIQTAASGTRVEMSGTQISFYYGSTYVGRIVGSTDSWTDPSALLLYSETENGYISLGDNSAGFEVFGSGYVYTYGGDTWIGADGTVYISGPVSMGNTSTSRLDVYGNLYVTGSNVAFPNITDSTAAANTRWGTTTGGRIFYSTASSQRYKENIVDISTIETLDPKKLLELPVRAFKYKNSYQKNTEDSRYQVMIPGFIAEEVEQYYPLAADYEGDVVESWNERMIVPGLLALVQDLYKRIEILEGK